MFDLGSWGEFLIIAVIALIVIEPKDMPKALKTAGRFVRKIRDLISHFQESIGEAIHQAEQDDLKDSIDKLQQPIDLNQVRKHNSHEKK